LSGITPGAEPRQPQSHRAGDLIEQTAPQLSHRPGWTEVTVRLTRWLSDAGAPYQLVEHAPASTSAEAARVRGTPLEAGAKALVLQAPERAVHVVVPAHRRLDNTRLRALLGTRTLRFATPDELLALTGCVPGAVPPFGAFFGLEALVDRGVAERTDVAFNAGSTSVSILMRGDDFLRVARAAVHTLARD
jgi:Ala-tRNA(Pro) deacylase